MTRVRSRGGMTLMELMVGLAVAGLALAAGVAAVRSVADHRRRAAESAARVEHAAAVRRRVLEWLSGAQLSPEAGGPEFRGIAGNSKEGSEDQLSFVTQADPRLARGVAQVRLYVDRDSVTPERGLVAAVTEWRGATPEERVELVPAATGLRARYLSALSAQPVWLSSWISSSVLPRAVELRVEAPVTDSIPPLLRLPLLVTLGGER